MSNTARIRKKTKRAQRSSPTTPKPVPPEEKEERKEPTEPSRPPDPRQILQRLLRSIPSQLTPAPKRILSQEGDAYLIFALGREWYAVPLSSVREIVRMRSCTWIPGAPPEIVGLMNLRGHMVLVYDSYRRLGISPSKEPRPRVLVLEDRDTLVGWTVGAHAFVAFFTSAKVQSPPPHLPEERAHLIRGVVQYEGRTISILDMERFLHVGSS